MLVGGVDLQRRRLLFQRADQDAVADGDDPLLLRIARLWRAVGRRRAGRPDGCPRPGVRSRSAHCPTLKLRGLAEIVPPQIAAEGLLRFGAPGEGLRTDKGRRFLYGKADLRIDGPVDVAALLARTAAGDDVAARTIAEIGRNRRRPLGELGRNIPSRPRGQAAGNAQRFQETLGDRIGFAAGQPPRPRRGIETLDRHHIGHAEAREGVTHIAFADEAAQIRDIAPPAP